MIRLNAKCPECGAQLEGYLGHPGNMFGPPDTWAEPEPPETYCPKCAWACFDGEARDYLEDTE